MTGDIPAISNYRNTSSTYGLGNLGQALTTTVGNTVGLPFCEAYTGTWGSQLVQQPFLQADWNDINQYKKALAQLTAKADEYLKPKPKQEKEVMADKVKRRLVQVFIADPNENVPLSDPIPSDNGLSDEFPYRPRVDR